MGEFFSPAGSPAAEFEITRFAFNPEYREASPDCYKARITSVEDFLHEYSCSRKVPPGCSPHVGARLYYTGTCGNFRKEVAGPRGRMFIFDQDLQNQGKGYYWNETHVPLCFIGVIYALGDDPQAVYRLTMTAQEDACDAHRALFTSLLDSFSVKPHMD